MMRLFAFTTLITLGRAALGHITRWSA